MTFAEYCRAVTGHIRFKPDRQGVEEELMAHLEDRREALTAKGVPEGEAEAEAVAAMGDPEEVGRALDKCHSPLLGWTQLCLKWLLVIAGIGGVFLFAMTLWASIEDHGSSFAALSTEGGTVLDVDAQARMGDYTFSVEEVCVKRSYQRDGAMDVSFMVKAAWLSPWLDAPSYTPVLYWVDANGDAALVGSELAAADGEDFWYDPSTGKFARDWPVWNWAINSEALSGSWQTQFCNVERLPAGASALLLVLDGGGWDVSLEIPLEGEERDG